MKKTIKKVVKKIKKVVEAPIELHKGTISVVSGSGEVCGNSTTFTRTFEVGSQIVANGEARNVSSITSDTLLTTEPWTNTATDVNYSYIY